MKWTVTKIKCGGGVVSESCVVCSVYIHIHVGTRGYLRKIMENFLIFFDNNII